MNLQKIQQRTNNLDEGARRLEARTLDEHERREQWLWSVCRKAAQEGQRKLSVGGVYSVFLYFRKGELTMAEDTPGDGWEIGDQRASRGELTEDQLTRRIYDMARRLPFLPD